MVNLEPIVGGSVGVGTTVALREMLDEEGGLVGNPGTVLDRLTRPSVLAGLGGGILTGALWYLDNEGIMETTPFGVDNMFWATHSVTATSSGAASALFPKAAITPNDDTKTSASKRTVTPTDSTPAGGSEPEDAGGSGGSQYGEAT
jgi:hypothetical protein